MPRRSRRAYVLMPLGNLPGYQPGKPDIPAQQFGPSGKTASWVISRCNNFPS